MNQDQRRIEGHTFTGTGKPDCGKCGQPHAKVTLYDNPQNLSPIERAKWNELKREFMQHA